MKPLDRMCWVTDGRVSAVPVNSPESFAIARDLSVRLGYRRDYQAGDPWDPWVIAAMETR